MNIIFLIAKRFLISRNLFQGGMINIVSFLGLFIGAASIVLSIAVLNGFQNVLGDETKKLYGDYILLDTNEDFVRNIDSDFDQKEMLDVKTLADSVMHAINTPGNFTIEEMVVRRVLGDF